MGNKGLSIFFFFLRLTILWLCASLGASFHQTLSVLIYNSSAVCKKPFILAQCYFSIENLNLWFFKKSASSILLFQSQPPHRTIEETSLSVHGSTNLEGGRNFHDHCPKHGGREKTVIDTETQVQTASKEQTPLTMPPVESQVKQL